MKSVQKMVALNVSLILGMAVVTGVAMGQVERVQVGRALDANPLVGSGGSNRPISGYVPGQVNGNDIVTGNVAGLAYFHGRTVEFAPNTFEGHLGSADLNNFARQSAGGIPTSIGPQPFYLPSTIVSGGQGNIYSTPYGSGFDSRYVPGSALSPLNQPLNGAYTGTAIPLRTFEPSAPVTDNGVMAPGRAIQSPLFSLRPESLPRLDTNLPPLDQKLNAPMTPLAPKPDEMKTDQTIDPLTGQPVDNANGEKNPDGTTKQQSTGALNERVKIASGAMQRVDGRPDDLRNARVGSDQLASSQLRVSDTYRDLTKNLDKASAEETTDQAGTNGLAKTDGTTPLTNGFGRKELTENGKTAEGKTPLPTMTDGSMAKEGVTKEPVDNGIYYQSTDPTLPGYRPKANLEQDRLARLEDQPKRVLRAGKKVDPLKSLSAVAGGQPITSFDTEMKNGEDLMKAGKYLDAAESYQNALTLQPDDLLALLGRGNAELAAGMFRSAEYDLKFVFTHKPAMVSVRYMLQNYIPTGRQDVLIHDLQDMTGNADQGNLGSFLLTYLYYNTERNKELGDELVRWKVRPWHDSWEDVADKAWGK